MPENDLTISTLDRLSCEERASGLVRLTDPRTEATAAVEEHLFLDLIPRIYRFALRLTNHNEHLAEDITQDTFVRAWKHRRRFRSDDHESLRIWMLRTAHNLARDGLRRERRKKRFEGAAADHSPATFSADAHPVADDEHERIRRAMATLPDRQREVLHLAACEGLPPRTIAAILNISPEAAKASLSLARKHVRAMLEDA